MLHLPRSARLAAWGSAALTGRATPDAAVRAITGSDEPHDVSGAEALLSGVDAAADSSPGGPAGTAGATLVQLFSVLASAGARCLRVALPAPGDPAGLPGPADFSAEAVEAGEAVLVDGELLLAEGVGRLGLVPEITWFGSAWEPGAAVTWRVFPTWSPRAPDGTTLADADRSLRTGLAEATRVLASLDVARWRDDAADRITAVREGALATHELPPGCPERAVRVVASAARVRAIVELATEDDGAAVSSSEALARARSLREVDGVARRALAVAVNTATAELSGTAPQP
ncbi:hypothetical protein SAMN06264364_12278 [Quadrisphaera granulorum]|uniref:Uncharacterized protein n=1 Tax=Quadrisphaera granulorum TaxID=317664 RepID=A0A315ZZL6_9ACTN|nr:hypothetical protein [Quadrisphaera granulorum]PWJ50702.1 hypothetical protein BXY45_12278 [Quadrisphaera granulorum]SZE97950.1 hypothetical protein SAMN06264364_12278 [Quadrisphaera granulorum]